MPSFHSDGVGQDGQDLLIMMLDQQAELPSVQRMRAWAAQVLAVNTRARVCFQGQTPGHAGFVVGPAEAAELRAADGRVVGANQAAVDAYGYDRETLLGLTISDLRTPEAQRTMQDDLERAAEAGAGA